MLTRTYDLIWTLLLLMVLGLPTAPAMAQPCPHDGDVNQDGNITPADALLAFQYFLEIAEPPLDACQQNRANVDVPETSDITPADALCIFQQFLGLSSCLDGATFDFILNVGRLNKPLYRLR